MGGTFEKDKFEALQNLISAHVDGINLINDMSTSLTAVKDFYKSYMKNAKGRLKKGDV